MSLHDVRPAYETLLSAAACLVLAGSPPAAAQPGLPDPAVTQVVAGADHTCALTAAGGVKCWGYNYYGQLGDGTATPSYTPTTVLGLSSGVVGIAASQGHHTCALTTGGGVKCWGWNAYGQLGDGTTINRSVPTDVYGLSSGVIRVAAGYYRTCAVTTAGGVKCWGGNGGAFGDGTTTSRTIPVDVPALAGGVARLAIGLSHNCVLMTGGGMKCSGRNNQGQLGDGSDSLTVRTTPVDVTGLTSGVAEISAGESHTCAVMVDGAVKCWGGNSRGQLGDGTKTSRTTPVNVFGLAGGVATLSAGTSHTCAVTATGGAKCWGGGGPLGDGTSGDQITPVDVSGLTSGVASIAAGGAHTCAVTTGAAVKCWGKNLYGQLGNGGGLSQPNAVDVLGLGGVSVSIDDPSIVEGNSGTSLLAFTVSLSEAVTGAVTVNYATSDGTATAGVDYTAASGSFTIPAGSVSKRLTIRVQGDTTVEPGETFTVTLSGVSGAMLGKSTGTATILNDDPPPVATTVTQYRLYHDGTKEHLYTTDLNEYNVLGTVGWIQEGIAYKMLTNGLYNGVATVPLFRLYHPGILQHHWTTDSNETTTLGATPFWFYEGTIGYLLPTQVSGSVPLYRMALANPALHLWTTDKNEYDTLATRGWIQEGIIGYVKP